MGFQSEQELVNLFKISYFNKYKIQRKKIFEEVNLGFGIADLVVSELKNENNCINRDKLTYIDINIYQIVKKNKKITFDKVKQISGVRKEEVNKSLKKLVEYSFIQKVDSCYIFKNKYELSYKKSIAFEAKLRNWKRALMQAYRYKWFADYSYVVLDESHSKIAIENLDTFKKLNIGLITLNIKGGIVIHYHPKKQKPLDISMQISLSEMILYQ